MNNHYLKLLYLLIISTIIPLDSHGSEPKHIIKNVLYKDVPPCVERYISCWNSDKSNFFEEYLLKFDGYEGIPVSMLKRMAQYEYSIRSVWRNGNIHTVTYSLKYRNNVLPAGLKNLQGENIEPKFLITEAYTVKNGKISTINPWEVVNGELSIFGAESYKSVDSCEKSFVRFSAEFLRLNSQLYKDGLIIK